MKFEINNHISTLILEDYVVLNNELELLTIGNDSFFIFDNFNLRFMKLLRTLCSKKLEYIEGFVDPGVIGLYLIGSFS